MVEISDKVQASGGNGGNICVPQVYQRPGDAVILNLFFSMTHEKSCIFWDHISVLCVVIICHFLKDCCGLSRNVYLWTELWTICLALMSTPGRPWAGGWHTDWWWHSCCLERWKERLCCITFQEKLDISWRKFALCIMREYLKGWFWWSNNFLKRFP